MAQCVYCKKETQLHVEGVPVCLDCDADPKKRSAARKPDPPKKKRRRT